MKVFLAAVGRMALSIIFIFYGMQKVMNWQETEQAITSALTNWMNWVPAPSGINLFAGKMIPYSFVLVVIAMLVELIGGLFIFFGYKPRFGAVILLLFLIPTTLLFHPFWFLQGDERDVQMAMFLKNLSIFGGLLGVLAFGTGSIPKKVSEPSTKA